MQEDIAREELVPVLEEFSTPFTGLYLDYPQRGHIPPVLPAAIAFLQGVARR